MCTIKEFNNYRPFALTSVIMNSFEHLVLKNLKGITGLLLELLQFAYCANQLAKDAVHLGLCFILLLTHPGTFSRIQFVDLSSNPDICHQN